MSYTAFLVQYPNVVKSKREEALGVGVDVGGCSLRIQETSPAMDQDHSTEIVSSCGYSLTKLEKDMVRDDKARICCGLFLTFSLGRNGLVSGWELEGFGMEPSSGSARCWMSRQSLELSRAGTALGLLAAPTAAAAPALALPSPWRCRTMLSRGSVRWGPEPRPVLVTDLPFPFLLLTKVPVSHSNSLAQ